MAFKLLLFDIDGTLLLGGGLGGRAMEQAGKELFGDSFSTQSLDTSGKIDPQIYQELADLHPHLEMVNHHDRFRDTYLLKLERELAKERSQYVLPGVFELLAALRETEHTLGLLTGNYSKAAPLKLKAANIQPDWFEVTAFGDEAASRPDLPPVAMRKYEARYGNLKPSEVMIIGDTPRDIDCAHANGCFAFGVATGSWSYESLQEAGAHHVAHDLSDAEAFLSLLLG
jgi:phosphoglycolate phosphatase-like HAD superfamily hydrolase